VVTTLGSMLSAAHQKHLYLGSTPAYWVNIKQKGFSQSALQKVNPDNLDDKDLAKIMALVIRANSSLICGLINLLFRENLNNTRVTIASSKIIYARLFSFDQLGIAAAEGYQIGILTIAQPPNMESHIFHAHFTNNNVYDITSQGSPRLLTPKEIRHHEIAMNEISEITGSYNTILIRSKQ
jgi:hypothetical protein